MPRKLSKVPPGASQAVQSILSCLPAASQTVIDPFLPPWCLASCPNGSFLPPWCLSGCPNGPFLPPCQREPCAPSRISKASLPSRAWSPPQDLPRTGPFAIEVVLKVKQNPASAILCYKSPLCLPGASQAVQMALSCLPGASWCLAGCPIDPFLPPWCLPNCPITSLVG